MKTGKKISDWLRELPDGYREKALTYKRQDYTISLLEDGISDAIAGAFAWRSTDEGYLFWKSVHDFYTGEIPSLPPLR